MSGKLYTEGFTTYTYSESGEVFLSRLRVLRRSYMSRVFSLNLYRIYGNAEVSIGMHGTRRNVALVALLAYQLVQTLSLCVRSLAGAMKSNHKQLEIG